MQKTWTSDFDSIINSHPAGHVLALCLHPALDVTVYTQNGKEIGKRSDLGGKAVNLARMLHLLGAQVTLVAPADKQGVTKEMLRTCGFDCELIETDLSLRKNYKYIDALGGSRESNGMAGTISPQHYQQLIDRVLHICQNRKISVLALCGSFPQGVEKAVYKYLTEQVKPLNIACVTDASKDALSLAVQAKPCLIKPNLVEFCQLTSQDIFLLKTCEQIQNAVSRAYLDLQTPVLCSLDKNGSIYAGPEGTYHVRSRAVEQINGFAGAGDTMLASYIYARFLCERSIEDSLRFASAAATAKVKLSANTLPDADQIFDEWTQTTIKKGGA